MRLGSLVLLAIVSAACRTNDTRPGPSEPVGRLRFVNVISDPTRSPVNAFLDGVPFGVNLGFGTTSPLWLPPPRTANYFPIAAGSRTLVLKRSADTSDVVGFYSLTITALEDRSVFATGAGGFTAIEIVDDNTTLIPAATRLRAVNISASAGNVDVFVIDPAANLAAATPIATNISFRGTSPYLPVAPGSYRMFFVRAGVAAASRNVNIVGASPIQEFTGGIGRTVVLAATALGSAAIVLADQ